MQDETKIDNPPSQPSEHSRISAETIQPPKVSFRLGFQKKQEVVVKRTTTQFSSGVVEESEEAERRTALKRGVVYLENGEILGQYEPSTKKDKTTYVIPMKATQNDWRIERLKKLVQGGGASDEDRARLALLIEALGGEATRLRSNQDDKPIIQASEAEDYDEMDADYEQVPIGEFGLAFLRGCGWKEEEGIGKTNKQVVKLRISEARPVRLGLGAQRKNPPGQDDSKTLKPSVVVEFLSGPDRKRFGVVRSMDEDNGSCYVELDKSGGKVVVVSQHLLEVKSSTSKDEKNGEARMNGSSRQSRK